MSLHEPSLIRLYSLRSGYLLMAVGLGVTVWPSVLDHGLVHEVYPSVARSLLACIGALSLLGLRYPVQMLPLMLFELGWKAIYLISYALPLWQADAVDEDSLANIQACLMVVIFIPLIPWRYVWGTYVVKRSERWA